MPLGKLHFVMSLSSWYDWCDRVLEVKVVVDPETGSLASVMAELFFINS